jgi:hypothetical protein
VYFFKVLFIEAYDNTEKSFLVYVGLHAAHALNNEKFLSVPFNVPVHFTVK